MSFQVEGGVLVAESSDVKGVCVLVAESPDVDGLRAVSLSIGGV